MAPEKVAARAAALERQDYSIHFHTFTPMSFLALVLRCRDAHGLPLEIVALETNGHEFILIARRTAEPVASPVAAEPQAAGVAA